MNSLKTVMVINSMLTNHCSVSVESASSGVCGGVVWWSAAAKRLFIVIILNRYTGGFIFFPYTSSPAAHLLGALQSRDIRSLVHQN